MQPGSFPTFHHAAFDAVCLAERKGNQRISVCIPARNEEQTIGEIVHEIRTCLVERVHLVDEILVVDDNSDDGTARVATEEGARVVSAVRILPEQGGGAGKGDVLWKSLFAAGGDVVIWCDADIRHFTARFVTGVLGPLLHDPGIGFVKGFYRRPLHDSLGGGRVTELVARPLLSLFFPKLAEIHQPLSGEYGGRRALLEQLPFAQGYGVDVGLLIDFASKFGTSAIAQVDLDVRHHRNRPLDQLSPQALAVAQTILRRAGVGDVPPTARLVVPCGDPIDVDVADHPPIVEIRTHLGRTA